VKHLKCKLCYQQLHLKYLCNLARYWLQAPWGWHDSVETCSSVIIVHLLVIVQNKKKTQLCLGYCPSSWISSGKTSQKPDVSIITGSYSVATPEIKLFSIINLYALRLWHISGGYTHSSTVYTLQYCIQKSCDQNHLWGTQISTNL
jgi:hypothetical protein